MKVSEQVLDDYKSNSITKYVTLHFPELGVDIGMEQIHFESMSLSENLIERESMEFVGCIASKFKIKVNRLREDVKGKRIVAKIATENTLEEPITLFNGIVDSAVKQSNKQVKEITAYDELYTKGNTEVAAWYKSLVFPVTLKNLRDSLFRYIGLEQEETILPNDAVTIERQYEPNTLQSLSVIKAICQINGAFGIINRKGKFEYRILGDIMSVPYPSLTLFPSENLFPASPDIAVAAAQRTAHEIDAESFAFYKKVEYEEYIVKPIDKVTIRQSEDDAGVTYGNGINNYIIQGNIFTYNLTAAQLRSIAINVYESIGGFSYYPFRSDNNGLPFLECGIDAVSYYVVDWDTMATADGKNDDVQYKQESFYVLNREMNGIQNLRDSYSAQGDEYQSEFITDLQTQIDTIKQNTGVDVKKYVNDYTYDKDYINDNFYTSSDIDDMFQNFEGGGGFNVESVESLPANPDDNTIYLIQGVVVVE